MSSHPTDPPAATPDRHARLGVIAGVAAYGLWGIIPAYFKLLAGVAPLLIVAHRIVWSMLLLGAAMLLTGGLARIRAALADPASRRALLLSSLLIAVNWLLYVYAIVTDRVMAGSIGYYLNPLANILLGRFVLGERLGRLQWAAVALAGVGVAVLAAGALDALWISLTLCFSFATYGLIRKQVTADSLTGLTVETMLLFPFALVALIVAAMTMPGPAVIGTGAQPWLLALAGLVSTVPLLLFTEAARRLNYSTVGMLQFIAPTLQFALAVFAYGEPFTPTHAIAFGAIWGAVALYIAGLLVARRG